jgi:hypothetical protein
MRIDSGRFGLARRFHWPSDVVLEFSSKIFSLPTFATQSPRNAIFGGCVSLARDLASTRESFVAFKKCLCRKAFLHA